MQYRTFEKTGERVSLLGFGAMRLPAGEGGAVDEAESIRMIRRAIDEGVNYVDTAYMYHGGNSETVVGKALKDGYREKTLLADKLPLWFANDASDLQKIFDAQIGRLDTEVIDMYLIHGVHDEKFHLLDDWGVMKFLEELRDSGRIKHIGFSYHGSPEFFSKLIDYYNWDFCQIQLNYMDADIQAGVAGLKYAGQKGVPVVVMEPLKGGKITENIPPQVQAVWDSAPQRRSPAEWAFSWVADFPEVLTMLSGMSAMWQLEENLDIMPKLSVASMTGDERRLLGEVAERYKELIKYGCTSCAYCLPECPEKIVIPEIIGIGNEAYIYDCAPRAKIEMTFQEVMPSACIACGKCEAVCPQRLPIPAIMKECAEQFE